MTIEEEPADREVRSVASAKQVQAAKRNIKRAQRAARAKKTITKLPQATRRDLGRQAAKARRRGGKAGRALEDRTRQQLYEVAKKRGVPGRSKMGKWELIKAIRKHG
jgi:Rho termination factor, N-terminal domain